MLPGVANGRNNISRQSRENRTKQDRRRVINIAAYFLMAAVGDGIARNTTESKGERSAENEVNHATRISKPNSSGSL